MNPAVVAAIIAASVSFLTLIGTLAAQFYGIRKTSSDTAKTREQQEEQLDRTLAEQREQLDRTLAEQREQLDRTLAEQHEQLDRTLAEQRTRTLNERFATAAGQLGGDKPPAVRLAGVYAMAGLADDWEKNRQTCVDVLCAYLRMPYQPDPGQDAPEPERLAFRASREVRHTVIRVIAEHLRTRATVSWQELRFDFRGVVFDGGDFREVVLPRGLRAVFDDAEFSGGEVRFDGAKFSGGTVFFSDAKFYDGTVRFDRAEFSGGEVSFRRADLSGGKVRFDCAMFSGGALGFDGAKFSGSTIDFSDAKFSSGEVDFSGALDWSCPPAFSWTGTPPPNVKLPGTEDQSQA